MFKKYKNHIRVYRASYSNQLYGSSKYPYGIDDSSKLFSANLIGDTCKALGEETNTNDLSRHNDFNFFIQTRNRFNWKNFVWEYFFSQEGLIRVTNAVTAFHQIKNIKRHECNTNYDE